MLIGNNKYKYFNGNRCLSLFLTDIRKIPLATVDEEEELVTSYKEGDQSAKNRLIEANLRFIYSVAKVYSRNEEEVLDYVNEGVIGLETALERFDPSKGYKFLTYGVWYIRRQMNTFLLTKRKTISNSAPVAHVQKKMDSVKQKTYAETGTVLSDVEALDIVKQSYDVKVKDERVLSTITMSYIDEPVSDDYTVEESDRFTEHTASDNQYNERVEREYQDQLINYYLSHLSEKERDIVKMRYGIGPYRGREISKEEISVKHNVSPERVDRICDAAFARIRYKENLI
jgi:RNA polymerase primary sigma factor